MPADIAEPHSENKSIGAQAQTRLDALAKPPGSLGQIERLAVRLCEAAGTLAPATRPRALAIFAADHGVVEAGVSLWPQAVTSAVARTLLAGKGGASVMARASDATCCIVDVGLAAPPPPHPQLHERRIRAGSRNLAVEPALTRSEFEAALAAGRATARQLIADGARLLIAGEVGIGNTTPAAAVTALLCSQPPAAVIGAGAGANAATRAAKHHAVTLAVARAQELENLADRLASLSGLEIAAMAGFYLEAADARIPVVLDGAISGAAALIAQALAPSSVDTMIASHLSPEPGHALALSKLGLGPSLRFDMRLGEGTGALALLPLLDMAAAIITDMATLDEALALAHA
jgi:nicotinate-nucleotide--dimethylbenzimidazole phosphoribosyltransferase